MIVTGVSYPITTILEESRLERLKHNIERGNYPVRSDEAEVKLEEFIAKEISKGYLFLIQNRRFYKSQEQRLVQFT